MHIYLIATGILFLFLGTVYDILSHTENVPLWIFPTGMAFSFVLSVLYDPYGIAWKGFVFLVFLILFGAWSYFFHLGGADVLAFLMLALNMGIYAINVALLAFILSMPQAFYCYRKNKDSDYPFIPYIFASYLVVIFLSGRRFL